MSCSRIGLGLNYTIIFAFSARRWMMNCLFCYSLLLSLHCVWYVIDVGIDLGIDGWYLLSTDLAWRGWRRVEKGKGVERLSIASGVWYLLILILRTRAICTCRQTVRDRGNRAPRWQGRYWALTAKSRHPSVSRHLIRIRLPWEVISARPNIAHFNSFEWWLVVLEYRSASDVWGFITT